jgi:hypothetical protein
VNGGNTKINRWENGVILPDSGLGGGQEPLSRVPGANHRPVHSDDYHFTVTFQLGEIAMQYDVEPNVHPKRVKDPNNIQQKLLDKLQDIGQELAKNMIKLIP